MAAIAPIEIFRGDTWIRSWTIMVNELPADFTGATARLQIRKSAKDPEFLLEASTETSGLTFVGDPTEGKIALKLQTQPLEAGKYSFDLEVTFADGVIQTYEQNTLVLKQDVTRT